MHDILEGILQYECKEMLKEFIFKEKYFTLEQLNERITNFDYGYFNDKNKPSPIARQTLKSDNNNLKQKGQFIIIMLTPELNIASLNPVAIYYSIIVVCIISIPNFTLTC